MVIMVINVVICSITNLLQLAENSPYDYGFML